MKPARWLCVICERPAMGATRWLTGYKQPVCAACFDTIRAVVKPTIHGEPWR